jgi:TetR/AcrR family transcriptional regulator, transcriptional repressor for nem operon
METNSKRDEILDVAEAMIRNAGFNAFSTRDIASAVGIKASSVHYYFPTKVDIGVAVTERYTDRLLKQLGDPMRFKGVREVVSLYVNAFRESLVRDDKLCLCAVLGAEIGGLPQEVGGHTRIFFDRNIAWLRKALSGSSKMSAAEANAFAVHLLAALEGGMMLSKSLGKEKVFESVAAMLKKLCDTVSAPSDR